VTHEHDDPADSSESQQGRAAMVWKASLLAVALAVVGIALVVVLWLLITLTISLIGSL
jgi:hypothetical protein